MNANTESPVDVVSVKQPPSVDQQQVEVVHGWGLHDPIHSTWLILKGEESREMHITTSIYHKQESKGSTSTTTTSNLATKNIQVILNLSMTQPQLSSQLCMHMCQISNLPSLTPSAYVIIQDYIGFHTIAHRTSDGLGLASDSPTDWRQFFFPTGREGRGVFPPSILSPLQISIFNVIVLL